MLPELLLRDLTIHRRVLLAAACLPLLFLGAAALAPPQSEGATALMSLMFGLLLLALLPVSLQVRESTLGTLGDLLSLPVARGEIVHLRFLEGLLACLLFLPCHLLLSIGFQPPPPGSIRDVLLSPTLLWVLVIFLAYPLPFALKWGGKGIGLAFGILIAGFFTWAFTMTFGRNVPGLAGFFRLLQAVETVAGQAHRAWGGASAALMDFGVPLLILAGLYGISLRVIDHVEA